MKHGDLEKKLMALGFKKSKQRISNHDTWTHKNNEDEKVFVRIQANIEDNLANNILKKAERISQESVPKSK